MAIEPSADIIGEEIRRELGLQLQHFEAIDSKAGLILGFSGVLVALSGSHLGKGVAALWALAACAALCASDGDPASEFRVHERASSAGKVPSVACQIHFARPDRHAYPNDPGDLGHHSGQSALA